MSWPTPQDYNEAIQTPLISFSDEDLRNGEAELTPVGIPKAMTGTFASVYKVRTASGIWAVRCFLSHRPEQKARYEKISSHVLMDGLDYTVQFHYLEEGIRVRNRWYPILKMNWVTGPTFDSYIVDNFDNPQKLGLLRKEFALLVEGLDKAGMAHCDLQHGNIIVSNQGLKLIDYDAMFVPALRGSLCLEAGHPNYQHPLRADYHFDTYTDNFSCWLIDISLEILSIDPHLLGVFAGGDECILFRQKDLNSPETSPLFNTLLNHKSERIQELTALIVRMLWCDPELIPELHKPEDLNLLPRIKPNREKTFDAALEKPNADTITLSNVTSGTGFHKDQGLSWQTPEAMKYAREKGKKHSRLFDQIYDRISTTIDTLDKRFLPLNWIEKRIGEGDIFYRDGNYTGAIARYSLAFQELNSRCEAIKIADYYSIRDFKYGRLLIDLAFKLGYILTLKNDTNIATIYFYTAHQQAIKFKGSGTNSAEIAQLALFLAINRYSRANHEDALRILKDNRSEIMDSLECFTRNSKYRELFDSEVSLNEIVSNLTFKSARLNKYKELIFSESALNLFFDFRQRMKQNNVPGKLDILWVLCVKIYTEIKDHSAPSTDKRIVEIFMEISDRHYNNEKIDRALDCLAAALNVVLAIILKTHKNGKEQIQSDKSVRGLFTTAGLKKLFNKYSRISSFAQSTFNLSSLTENTSLLKVIANLENATEDERIEWIDKVMTEKSSSDLKSFLHWTGEKGFFNLRRSLECYFISKSSEHDILNYFESVAREKQIDSDTLIEILANSSMPEDNHLPIVKELISNSSISAKPFLELLLEKGEALDLCEQVETLSNQGYTIILEDLIEHFRKSVAPKKVVLLSRALSTQAYQLLLEAIEPAIFAHGEVRDIVRHMEEIGGRSAMPRSVKFLESLIIEKQEEFLNEVLAALLEVNFNQLVLKVYRSQSYLVNSLILKHFEPKDIVFFVNLIQEFSLLNHAEEIMAQLVRRKNKHFLDKLFKAACEYSYKGEKYIQEYLFLLNSDNDRWTKLEWLIEKSLWKIIKNLIFKLAFKRDQNSLDQLEKRLEYANDYKVIESPISRVFVDEYLKAAFLVSRSFIKEDKVFTYIQWEIKLDIEIRSMQNP